MERGGLRDVERRHLEPRDLLEAGDERRTELHDGQYDGPRGRREAQKFLDHRTGTAQLRWVNPVIEGDPSVIQPTGLRHVWFDESRPETRGRVSVPRPLASVACSAFVPLAFFSNEIGMTHSFGWNYPRARIGWGDPQVTHACDGPGLRTASRYEFGA
jgi:hypothetical protein